jgi:C1A family cysteine protease
MSILISSQRGFGWSPQPPDYRDYRLSASKLSAVGSLPRKWSLREHDSPVRDQGNIGSCTGFAMCGVIEMLRRTDEDNLSTIYSPLFAYYFGRIEDGAEWASIDSGAYIRDLAKVAARIGVCPESSWKYEPAKFARKPSASAIKAASRWKSGKYYALKTVEEIKVALVAGYGVMGGFSCFSNMFTQEVDRTGKIPMPGGGFEGGHAVKFSGYDDDQARFTDMKNSWSGKWGDHGYGSLPYAFVEQGLATDFWAIEREAA